MQRNHATRNTKIRYFFPELFFLGILLVAASIAAQDTDSGINLDVRDADLREVFMKLADKAKINILLSPKIKGTVTCRVSGMDPRELIEFLARTNGLVTEEHRNILLILAEYSTGTHVRFEIIPLQNARAADVEKMIQNLKLDKRTKVTHDERTNRLIVIYEE